MLTQMLIATLILRGQAYRAQLVRAYASQEYGGNLNVNWVRAEVLSQQIQALSFCLAVADYSSANCLAVYDHLSQCLGTNFASGVFTDPNIQPPGGNVVVINQQGASGGTDAQIGKIPFNAEAGVTFVISDYQGLYASTYGNNPFLAVYVPNPDTGVGFREDTGTVPSITFVGGDEANGIDTISIYYPYEQTGYIQILGIKQSS